MKFDIALPGFVKTTSTKYKEEMERLKGIIGEADPENWINLTGEQQEAAFAYVNNIYFCTDTSEIYNKEICYGFSSMSQDKIDQILDAVVQITWMKKPQTPVMCEQGSSVTASFSWQISINNGNEVSPSSATVNGGTEGVAADKKSFRATSAINSDTTYKLIVGYGSQQTELDIEYKFGWKKYFGVSEKATLTSADVIQLQSEWIDEESGAGLKTTTFNCTGGKYPYLCVPKGQANGLSCWVNGLKNTDIVTYDLEVTNASGGKSQYTCIRLDNLQNSSLLSIEFK